MHCLLYTLYNNYSLVLHFFYSLTKLLSRTLFIDYIFHSSFIFQVNKFLRQVGFIWITRFLFLYLSSRIFLFSFFLFLFRFTFCQKKEKNFLHDKNKINFTMVILEFIFAAFSLAVYRFDDFNDL